MDKEIERLNLYITELRRNKSAEANVHAAAITRANAAISETLEVNRTLLNHNIGLKHMLEAAQENARTFWWAAAWFGLGAVFTFVAFVCLSLAVYP